MANIKPFSEAPWFEIDEDQYLMYLLKGYEIDISVTHDSIRFNLNGQLHREDGPAVIWDDGVEFYYLNGSSVYWWDNRLKLKK